VLARGEADDEGANDMHDQPRIPASRVGRVVRLSGFTACGPFRVLLAKLIADNVCRRIVEEHARAQPHQFDSDKIYLLHNRLMKEFTPIAHRIQLADASV
jgi:hypothetical protein